MGDNQDTQKYGEPLQNDITVTWKKSKQPFQFPSRDGHASCGLGNNVYVFGGVIQGEPGEITEVNELLMFDTVNEVWSRPDCKGDLPIPSSMASLTAVGTKLYLYGGLSHEVAWLDNLYVFDTESGEWSLVEGKDTQPSPRDKMAAVVIATKIYYFGGFGPTCDYEEISDNTEEEEDVEKGVVLGWFNDLHIFDTVTSTWTQPMQMNLGVPSPRAAHTMCAVGSNLFIFGGKDAEARQNDLYMFDTVSRKWDTKMKVRGQQPEPRSFHSATSVGQRMVVMGGRGIANQHLADFHIFDSESKEWLQPRVEGDIPAGRCMHAAVMAGDFLVLFGGSSNLDPETNECKDIFSDTYLVKTENILKGKSTPEQAASESPVKQNGMSNGH